MAEAALPASDTIVENVRSLILKMYGEEGYTLGEDGFDVRARTAFKKIVKLKPKDSFIDELFRRYDAYKE